MIDIGTVLFDYLSSRLNETWQEHAPWLLWLVYLLFYVFYLTRIYMFFAFTISVLDARGGFRSKLYMFSPVVYFPCLAVTVSTPLTHWVFLIRNGYQPGPLEDLVYFCSICYLVFAIIAILRRNFTLRTHELIGLLGLQIVLIAGNIIRALLPTFMVMNTFSLMAILVIFLSFQNPDLFLADRGYVYNLPAFKALLLEWNRRKKLSRMVAFVLRNYTETREIAGGQVMDETMVQINRYLAETFPHLCSFYLHHGCYAIAGSDRNQDMDKVAATLEKRFSEPWKTEAGELLLKISVLRADTELDGVSVDSLINTLLISLDEAGQTTQENRNQTLSDSIQAINEKLDVRRCLEKALERNTLEVFLQPIVDSESGQRIAAEALVRLRDDQGKIIRPDLFINLAEKEGYIIRLGEQVLEKVCEFIRDHDLNAMGIQWINVNLSPIQCMHSDLPRLFDAILQEYGVPAELIHLEITEESMVNYAKQERQIEALHRKGFQLALDDYGAGFSNLHQVKKISFSNIKLDMKIVWDYIRDRDSLLPSLRWASALPPRGLRRRRWSKQWPASGAIISRDTFSQGHCRSKNLSQNTRPGIRRTNKIHPKCVDNRRGRA